MSLHHLSMVQALSIWSELEQAYFGKNGYGGDTAEIYIYRLMPSTPSAPVEGMVPSVLKVFEETLGEVYDRANVALHDLLVLFAELREADIEINGKALGKWLREARFDHRVHVVVRPRRSR